MSQRAKWNAFHVGSGTEGKKEDIYNTTSVVRVLSLEASDLSSRLSALSPLIDFDFGNAGVSSCFISSVALCCSIVIFRIRLSTAHRVCGERNI